MPDPDEAATLTTAVLDVRDEVDEKNRILSAKIAEPDEDSANETDGS